MSAKCERMWLVKGNYTKAYANFILMFTGFFVFHHILNLTFMPKRNIIILSNCANQTTNFESKIISASNKNRSYSIDYEYPETLCLPNDTLKCLPAFVPSHHSFFKSAYKYKLSACVIPKSMSTIITSFMCLLHDEKKYNDANQTFAENIWDKRFCGSKNENIRVKDILYDANSTFNGWQLFSVVRDPVERFLSAFVHLYILLFFFSDKHDCFNCGSNFSCFVEKAYYQSYGFAEGKDIIALHINMHFLPQNWYCQFGEYYGDYKIIHYKSPSSSEFETMVSQIIKVLNSRQNIPKSTIKSIQNELLRKDLTVHATVNNPLREKFENELKSNKETMKYFIKLYYHDYVLFKFPMPEYFKDILNEI